jgi:hypothetical protein
MVIFSNNPDVYYPDRNLTSLFIEMIPVMDGHAADARAFI